MIKSILKRIIAVVLALSMLVPLLSGCTTNNDKPANTTTPEVTSWIDDTTEQPNETKKPIDEIIVPVTKLSYSENWEDYLGDLETFVYGMIINTLESSYDVFPAEVFLSDGISVLGLAYTDYSECYAPDDDYDQCCFAVGFIPLIGEPSIAPEEYEKGLEVYNLDFADEDTSFFLEYSCEPFTDHCVVYTQYLKYGVDENGYIFYEATPYIDYQCDEALGDLYSYDRGKYLFTTDVGKYSNISGESLSSQIDFADLEKEINDILDNQDINFASIDLNSCAYFAQDAITSYLLSLQEETFLGYDVQTLIKEAEALDPLECFRIGPNGISTISIDKLPEPTASDLTKWLIGTGCVIVTAVSVIGSIVFMECPPLSSACSAAMGVAIEMFMQVIIDEKTLDNVNWTKVAIAAATGAVSGFLGPYVMATCEGAAYFFLDSALDGLVAGIERTVTAWMDGVRGTDVLKSFGTGFAIGFAISGAFKVVGKVVEKVANNASKLMEKMMPKLTKKIGEFTEALSKPLYKLKSKADASIFHSEYISKKLTNRQLQQIIQHGDNTLTEKSFKQLPNDDIFDNNGNKIDKETLEELFEKSSDNTNLAYYLVDGEKVIIKKQNGIVSIFFDESKYQKVPVDLIPDRDANMLKATTLLQDEWKKNPNKIPDSIAEALKAKGISIDDIAPEDLLKNIIKKSDWVLHENADLKTIILVPRALHDKVNGWNGIGHMGGFGLIKHIKTHMGQEFFDRIIQAVSSWTANAVAQGG